MTLNESLEEDSVESPKWGEKASYPPNRRGPSAGHVAAQRITSPENSPEAIASTSMSALKGVPSGSPNSVAKSSESTGVLPLPGVQGMPKNAWETSQPVQESSQEAPIALQTRNDLSTLDNPQQDKLPDLVTVKTGKDTGTEVTLTADTIEGNPESEHPRETFNIDPLSTEDELDAVDALLSLSGIQDENADPTTENELLMPIGGANLPLDVAPVPIELGQVEVDHAIAKLATQEEEQSITEKQPADNAQDPNTAPPPNVDLNDNSDLSPPRGKGEFRTTHALKKKAETKHTYKCRVCGVRKPSMHKLNNHHKTHHGPQMCGICSHIFSLASSLNRHMYSHDERRYQCEKCNYSCHFESELESHKIIHRKTPTHKCMVANCDRWFKHKWELTSHVRTHDEDSLKCDKCDFTTQLEKHLKEHKRRHINDLPYACKLCKKGFKYRSGLKGHKDKDHKDHK